MDEKTCASCGRRIKYQKRWRNNWESVRYCSDRCRHEKLDKTDSLLEQSLLALLETKATICPSEAAQAVSKDWQRLYERSRRAARRLVSAGKLEMLQNGRVVDPSTAKGPVRLRKRLKSRFWRFFKSDFSERMRVRPEELSQPITLFRQFLRLR